MGWFSTSRPPKPTEPEDKGPLYKLLTNAYGWRATLWTWRSPLWCQDPDYASGCWTEGWWRVEDIGTRGELYGEFIHKAEKAALQAIKDHQAGKHVWKEQQLKAV